MAKTTKKTTIKFRGKNVELQYTLASLIALEEMGINLTQDFESDGSVKEVVTFILAGLITQFPDATMEEIGAAYKLPDMKQLAKAISEGIK